MSFTRVRSEPTEWGRLAESAVGAHLLNSGLQHRFEVYYWNQGGFEVDYVIQKGHEIVAIEVKSGKDTTNKGLALFNDAFQPRSIYFVGTEGIPFEQFLSMNPAELFN